MIAAAAARAADSSRAPSGHASAIHRASSAAATAGNSHASAASRVDDSRRVRNSATPNASTR